MLVSNSVNTYVFIIIDALVCLPAVDKVNDLRECLLILLVLNNKFLGLPVTSYPFNHRLCC